LEATEEDPEKKLRIFDQKALIAKPAPSSPAIRACTTRLPVPGSMYAYAEEGKIRKTEMEKTSLYIILLNIAPIKLLIIYLKYYTV
jgi:hypothetical protein